MNINTKILKLSESFKWLIIILIPIITMFYAGCKNVNETAPTDSLPSSTSETESADTGIDWSTVTPEDLWTGVSQIYEEDGAQIALLLLELGMEKGIVSDVEANQRRAGYLYELGRMNEAFLALTIYKLDEDHPDLLRLRAEVLWSMGRYYEAQRDYEMVLGSMEENPDPLVYYQLARLYEELGEWDLSDAMVARLNETPDDPAIHQHNLVHALKSENIDDIRDAGLAVITDSGERNPMATFAAAYGAFLEGSYDSAREIIDDYTRLYGDDMNIRSLQLRINAESNDFEAFESDLRTAFESQGSLDWLDAPVDVYPHPPVYQTYIAGLLDFASALELGKGNPLQAELLAGRAVELNPYDPIAHLQQAAISMTINDMESCYGKLILAKSYASPTDIRTRLRMVQFAVLAGDDVEVLWENSEILAELETVLDVLTERYPGNAFFKSANAEVEGFRGNISGALELYSSVTELPGATRENYYRQAYWTAVSGNVAGAFEIFSRRIPSGSPDLTWAKALHREADVTGNEYLSDFAQLVINHLDPQHQHAEIFY